MDCTSRIHRRDHVRHDGQRRLVCIRQAVQPAGLTANHLQGPRRTFTHVWTTPFRWFDHPTTRRRITPPNFQRCPRRGWSARVLLIRARPSGTATPVQNPGPVLARRRRILCAGLRQVAFAGASASCPGVRWAMTSRISVMRPSMRLAIRSVARSAGSGVGSSASASSPPRLSEKKARRP